MLLAIELKSRPVPDVADGFGIDVTHAGDGRDVVSTNHDVAAGIDVQALKNEGTRNLIRIEIGCRVGGAACVESGVGTPGQELPLDEVIDANVLHPVAFDGIDIDAGLVDRRGNYLARAPHFVAEPEHALC